jgi:protein-tyrosine phosphatase
MCEFRRGATVVAAVLIIYDDVKVAAEMITRRR